MKLVPDCYGGPGWIISGENLRPVITDLNVFRANNQQDVLTSAIEKLWSGKTQEAEEMLLGYEETFRVKALLAECKTYGGKPAEAVEILEELLCENTGTVREATIRQHLGKAYLALGNNLNAEEEFTTALNLRKTLQQDEDLIASSQQALDYVQKLISNEPLETVKGRIVSDEEIYAWSEEAERGYSVESLPKQI